MTTQTTPKTALITGASRGLGRSSALHLARAGWGVIGTYRSERAEAEAVLAEVRGQGVPAAALQLDVGAAASDAAVREAFVAAVRDALGRAGADGLRAVVHFAGHGVHAPYAETTAEQLEELLRVHVSAPFLLTQALLPLLGEGSRVVNVSSGLARFTNPGYAAYAAAKGAVEVMTRYQAAELGERGIRVNVLAPGAIATDFGGGVVRDVAAVGDVVARATALGRVGLPEDIGAVVPQLLSDGFGWASGTRIEVSGGQQL
ncbi:SDR family NAD(P)-dependent oxidoreductase [Quadrisphaera sp. KR29]|uniref:SDR family NAD(P)-dependent oxidoreductase n=1 Tax=Quadrisphaera sp. KR29 TaxID=3461391 RepID=UPI0040444F6B